MVNYNSVDKPKRWSISQSLASLYIKERAKGDAESVLKVIFKQANNSFALLSSSYNLACTISNVKQLNAVLKPKNPFFLHLFLIFVYFNLRQAVLWGIVD